MKKWAMVVLLLLLAGGAMAQQSDEATLAAVNEYTAGQEALKKGNLDVAIRAFEKAVSLNPELFISHYYLGAAYQAKQDSANTLKHFRKYLEKVGVDTGSAEAAAANRGVGVNLYRSKKMAEAVPYLQRAVRMMPKDKEVHFFLGMALRETDETGAEKHFAKVIDLDPKLALPYYYAGRIAFKNKNTAAAQTRLEGFLNREAKGPRAAQAHYMLGSLAAQAGDNAKAASHFEKYLVEEPGGAQAPEVKKFLDDYKAQQGS